MKRWLQLKYYKWRCSRLKNPGLPSAFTHKTDGTLLSSLELYKLTLYINTHYSKKRRKTMKTVRIMWMVATVLLMAGNAHAGLLDKLLGIEAPETAMRASATPAAPQEIAVWLIGTVTELDNPNAEVSTRLGWRNDDTEFGLQFDVIGTKNATGGKNTESLGAYFLLFAGEILGESYIGYAGSVGREETVIYGPVVGTVIDFVVVEYRYRDFKGDSLLDNAKDRHQIYAGLRIPF